MNAAPVRGVYNQAATTARRPHCLNGRAGDRPVILSLQKTFSETRKQAQSRLAVLRQGLRQGLSGQGRTWSEEHRATYLLSSLGSCLPLPLFPIFGGTAGFDSKPACRMPAANPLTSARGAFGDTSVNVQEGTP
jgi:hypothetical protein